MADSIFNKSETPANFLCIPYLHGRCNGCANYHPEDRDGAEREYNLKRCQRICNKFNDSGCKFSHCKFLHIEMKKIIIMGESIKSSATTVLSPLMIQVMRLEQIKNNLSKHKKRMGDMFAVPPEFTQLYDDTVHAVNAFSKELDLHIGKIQILNHFI